jgi:UDP-GlcNAc:undecaprenyl-phosphate GlcNAc-1-phosphate transferase
VGAADCFELTAGAPAVAMGVAVCASIMPEQTSAKHRLNESFETTRILCWSLAHGISLSAAISRVVYSSETFGINGENICPEIGFIVQSNAVADCRLLPDDAPVATVSEGELSVTVLVLGFTSSLLLSFLLTKLVRDLAIRRQWLSYPSSGRHLHTNSIPRLGGIAIVASFLIATAISLIARQISLAGHALALAPLPAILPPAILIFLLGVYDDLRSATPYFKFSVQAVAGAMLFAGGLRIIDVPLLLGAHKFAWYTSLPLTILWVIGITNAFNLIDGLDGLAAGSALFSTLVVFVVALLGNLPLVALITLTLAGAILGFLRFNFNPATIFLGDCGSLFIGFMLSSLALYDAQRSPTIIAVAIPVVSFGLPILETSLSVLRRWISGRPLFSADREHIHHKLLQRGMSQRQVVILLYGVSAMFALLSLFLLWPTGSTLGLVFGVLGTGIWIGVQHLGYLEFGELRRAAQKTFEQRQVFINNLAIRRAVEQLKRASNLQEVSTILVDALEASDFDAFELRAELPARSEQLATSPATVCPHIRWKKPGSASAPSFGNMWSIHLDLLSALLRRSADLSGLREPRAPTGCKPHHFRSCCCPRRCIA